MKIKPLEIKSLGKAITKALRGKALKRFGLYFGIAVAALALLLVIFNSAYSNRVFPRTMIGETNFGGLSRDQASEKLKTLIDSNKDSQLHFSYADKDFSKKISDLGVDYNAQVVQTIDNLFNVGRKGSLGKILAEQFKAMFAHNRTVAGFSHDNVKLGDFLGEIAKSVNKPEKDATIAFTDSVEPYVQGEEAGQDFPIDENTQIALKTIGTFFFSEDTPFVVDILKPKIDSKMAGGALEKTRELLNRHLVISAREKQYEIKPSDIPGLLEFTTDKNTLDGTVNSLIPKFSTDKVGAFVDSIAKDVNQEAKDAQFKVESGRVVTFQTAQTGYALVKDEAVKAIISALNSGEQALALQVKETNPEIATSDPASAGITELIGEGKTSWRGSPANRIHNLQLGASRISGTIVKPGEEFSTVGTIAPITAAAGFLPELVIKNSTKVEPDIGGGLCQVSTTLFRAVLHSGLKITARTPHSFRVSYYEPPVGMDATIFDPAPDLKFINNMDTPILIWAIAGSNNLTFQIYGTKDGRNISISDPVKFNYVSPPADIYTLSASMAAGAVRQVEKATAGVTTSFTYKVTSASGNVLSSDTFVSKYVAIPNMFLFGEGFAVPGSTPSPPPAVEGAAAPAPEVTTTP